MQDLISAWEKFDASKRPFVLEGDYIPLEVATKQLKDWDEFIDDHDFGAQNDDKLHLDLLPIPFIGNLKSASVFLLMLNPGLGPHDYFSEYKIPEYRTALVANIHQKELNSFLFLDPIFSWHGGYEYWHSKLHQLIKQFGETQEPAISYGNARRFFQQEIAVVELVPYRSISFSLSDKVIESLNSARLAREFVKEQAETKDCLVVVTRSVKQWNLPERDNIVCFNSQQARSAHLSAQGKKILEFLGRRYADCKESQKRTL